MSLGKEIASATKEGIVGVRTVLSTDYDVLRENYGAPNRLAMLGAIASNTAIEAVGPAVGRQLGKVIKLNGLGG
jgi:hypothetical protein